MQTQYVRKPAFGAKVMADEYYRAISRILSTLQPYATYRVMAEHLNRNGFATPTNKPWNKYRLAGFLRHNMPEAQA